MVCGTSASGFSRQVGYLYSVFRFPRPHLPCVPVGGYCICYSVLLICVGDGEPPPTLCMYQERLRASGIILPHQFIVFINNTPGQDIDLSRDVMVVFFRRLGINCLTRIVNRSTETGDLCHVYSIDVVTDYTFKVIQMLNLLVIVCHAGVPNQSPVDYFFVRKFAVNLRGCIFNSRIYNRLLLNNLQAISQKYGRNF